MPLTVVQDQQGAAARVVAPLLVPGTAVVARALPSDHRLPQAAQAALEVGSSVAVVVLDAHHLSDDALQHCARAGVGADREVVLSRPTGVAAVGVSWADPEASLGALVRPPGVLDAVMVRSLADRLGVDPTPAMVASVLSRTLGDPVQAHDLLLQGWAGGEIDAVAVPEGLVDRVRGAVEALPPEARRALGALCVLSAAWPEQEVDASLLERVGAPVGPEVVAAWADCGLVDLGAPVVVRRAGGPRGGHRGPGRAARPPARHPGSGRPRGGRGPRGRAALDGSAGPGPRIGGPRHGVGPVGVGHRPSAVGGRPVGVRLAGDQSPHPAAGGRPGGAAPCPARPGLLAGGRLGRVGGHRLAPGPGLRRRARGPGPGPGGRGCRRPGEPCPVSR